MQKTLLIFFILVSNFLFADVQQLALGDSHACALSSSGKIKCWGQNVFGQLGLGDELNRGNISGQMGENLPFVDLGTGEKAVRLSVGRYHSCAILQSGKVKCWGGNSQGQLGLGDTLTRGNQPDQMGDALPFVDLEKTEKAVELQSGETHTCALFQSGKAKCWGRNLEGQLGLGDSLDRGSKMGQMGASLPFVDLGTGAKVTAISLGAYHSCALLNNGRIKCWGLNIFGQLGLGDLSTRGDNPLHMGDHLPYVELSTTEKVISVKLGNHHSCAVLDSQKMKCWGNNGVGQLGLGDSKNRGGEPGQMGDFLPYTKLGQDGKVNSISLGGFHSCALFQSGMLKCWGYNVAGQLGLGDNIPRGSQPSEVGDFLPTISLGLLPKHFSTGTTHVCAVLLNGGLKCWGNNLYGQLGQEQENTIGDNPGEMGADLDYTDLGVEFRSAPTYFLRSAG